MHEPITSINLMTNDIIKMDSVDTARRFLGFSFMIHGSSVGIGGPNGINLVTARMRKIDKSQYFYVRTQNSAFTHLCML